MLHRVPSYRRSCGLESLPGPEIWEAALPKHCNLSRILPILVANSEFMFHSAGFLRHPRLLTTPSSYSLFAGPTGIPWDRSCRKAVATLKIVGTRVETKGDGLYVEILIAWYSMVKQENIILYHLRSWVLGCFGDSELWDNPMIRHEERYPRSSSISVTLIGPFSIATKGWMKPFFEYAVILTSSFKGDDGIKVERSCRAMNGLILLSFWLMQKLNSRRSRLVFCTRYICIHTIFKSQPFALFWNLQCSRIHFAENPWQGWAVLPENIGMSPSLLFVRVCFVAIYFNPSHAWRCQVR